ncbi:MAG: TIGR04211 family SH3 domain-containing protein [Magnetococcales bacterium]|nr:TIGR04211 family SH3 domain-containing protein [Magnetococcales bacterium]
MHNRNIVFTFPIRVRHHNSCRMMTLLLSFVFLFLGLNPTLELQAQEPQYRYVADEFRITLRRGPAATFKVVRMLSTGMKLTLLEKGTQGWDRVKTAAGEEGWVLRRFIKSEVPAQLRIIELDNRYQQIFLERQALQEEVELLKESLKDKEQMTRELEEIREVSGRALILDRENLEMRTKQERIDLQLEKLSLENMALKREADTRFFLAGAAVLILGVIIGAILFRRRRPSYDSL